MKGWRIVSVEIPSTNIALDAKGGSYVYYNIVVKYAAEAAAAPKRPASLTGPPRLLEVHFARRYNQFHTLHTQLKVLSPVFVAGLGVEFPPKQIFGRFEDETRERRRKLLEAYINAVSQTEPLMSSQAATAFFNSEVNGAGKPAASTRSSRDSSHLE